MEAATVRLLIGLLRHLLQGVSGWLIAKGIASEEDITTLVTGLVIAATTAASFWWQQWREKRQKKETA